MSDKELNEWITHPTPEPSIKWIPEDYGFIMPEGFDGVWYKDEYELRSMKGERWLMRRKIKNKNNNPEKVVKWGLIKIPLNDKELADVMFSKGLK